MKRQTILYTNIKERGMTEKKIQNGFLSYLTSIGHIQDFWVKVTYFKNDTMVSVKRNNFAAPTIHLGSADEKLNDLLMKAIKHDYLK